MTSCECHLAGYCNRHRCKKTFNQVKLCQTNPKYWEAWENGKGPGQIQPTDPVRKLELELRAERVREAKAKNQRLIDWVKFFKHESDSGLGDSFKRLMESRRKHPIKSHIQSILKATSCNVKNAVNELNRLHPYSDR